MRGHTHVWRPQQSGCRENPGVWSEGHQMIYHKECRCGATKVERRSIIAGHHGSLKTITSPSGDVKTTDTRNWT